MKSCWDSKVRVHRESLFTHKSFLCFLIQESVTRQQIQFRASSLLIFISCASKFHYKNSTQPLNYGEVWLKPMSTIWGWCHSPTISCCTSWRKRLLVLLYSSNTHTHTHNMSKRRVCTVLYSPIPLKNGWMSSSMTGFFLFQYNGDLVESNVPSYVNTTPSPKKEGINITQSTNTLPHTSHHHTTVHYQPQCNSWLFCTEEHWMSGHKQQQLLSVTV